MRVLVLLSLLRAAYLAPTHTMDVLLGAAGATAGTR